MPVHSHITVGPSMSDWFLSFTSVLVVNLVCYELTDVKKKFSCTVWSLLKFLVMLFSHQHCCKFTVHVWVNIVPKLPSHIIKGCFFCLDRGHFNSVYVGSFCFLFQEEGCQSQQARPTLSRQPSQTLTSNPWLLLMLKKKKICQRLALFLTLTIPLRAFLSLWI